MKTIKKPHYAMQIFAGVFLIISILGLSISRVSEKLNLLTKIFGGLMIIIFFIFSIYYLKKNQELEEKWSEQE